MKIEESFDPTEKDSWLNLIILVQNAYLKQYTFVYIFNIIAKIIDFRPIEIKNYFDRNL